MILAGAALRWRRLRPTFWAAVAGLVTLLVATRMSPGGLIRPPESPRYLYPEAILFLWILVELAAAWRDAGTPGPEPWSPALATGVLLLGLWSNVSKLGDASRSILRANSMIAEASVQRVRPRAYPPQLELHAESVCPDGRQLPQRRRRLRLDGAVSRRARTGVPAGAGVRRQSIGRLARAPAEGGALGGGRRAPACAAATSPSFSFPPAEPGSAVTSSGTRRSPSGGSRMLPSPGWCPRPAARPPPCAYPATARTFRGSFRSPHRSPVTVCGLPGS